MPLVDLQRDGTVFVLTMHNGENRFSPPFIDALSDVIEPLASGRI